MADFTETDTQLLLTCSTDSNVSNLSKDAALVKSLTKVLKATLDLADSKVLESRGKLVMALSKKALSISSLASSAAGSKGFSSANFLVSQTLTTIGLTKLAGMTPAKASLYLTVAAANKIVSAAAFGQADKCKVAVASLAANTGEGALVCFATGAFSLGVGCVAGMVSIAAEAFDVYGQCYSPQSK